MFSALEGKDKLVIEVLDTGVGIEQNDLKLMFKMFGFLKNTKQMNTKGVGLGLFISNKIVKEFGGQIIVKSEYGKGTRFTYSFVLET